MLKSGKIDNNHIALISNVMKNQAPEEIDNEFISNILKNYVIEKEKEMLNNPIGSVVEFQEKVINRI